MFDDRTYKRTFYSAPQSVTSLVAAFMEPAITVLVFLLANIYIGEPINRPELTLSLLVFALTFPGRNRFRDNMVAAGVDIASSCFRSRDESQGIGRSAASFGDVTEFETLS